MTLVLFKELIKLNRYDNLELQTRFSERAAKPNLAICFMRPEKPDENLAEVIHEARRLAVDAPVVNLMVAVNCSNWREAAYQALEAFIFDTDRRTRHRRLFFVLTLQPD